MLAATEANSLAGASGKGIFLQSYSLYKPQKCCINSWAWPWILLCQHVARWRCRLWYNVDRLFTRSLCTPKAVLQYGSNLQVFGQPTTGVFVFRRVQEGYHGEPAITRERKHFSKIHPSDYKPSTRLACSYLNWSEEVSAALCSAVDRMNERTNEEYLCNPRRFCSISLIC